MWWTLFTAVDLYIGLIILDSAAGAVPPEKQARLAKVRKVVLALLILVIIFLAAQIVLNYRHHSRPKPYPITSIQY